MMEDILPGLQISDVHATKLDSVQGKAVMDGIRDSFVNKNNLGKWQVDGLNIVDNPKWTKIWNSRRGEMVSLERCPESDKGCFLFTCYKSDDVVRNILINGLAASSSDFNYLGNSEHGIHLCRHADIQLNAATAHGGHCWLVLFKVVLGRQRNVCPKRSNHQLWPHPNYDCHVSSCEQISTMPASDQFIHSQVYVYECGRLRRTFVASPRQVLPYAILACHHIDSSYSNTMRVAPSTIPMYVTQLQPQPINQPQQHGKPQREENNHANVQQLPKQKRLQQPKCQYQNQEHEQLLDQYVQLQPQSHHYTLHQSQSCPHVDERANQQQLPNQKRIQQPKGQYQNKEHEPFLDQYTQLQPQSRPPVDERANQQQLPNQKRLQQPKCQYQNQEKEQLLDQYTQLQPQSHQYTQLQPQTHQYTQLQSQSLPPVDERANQRQLPNQQRLQQQKYQNEEEEQTDDQYTQFQLQPRPPTDERAAFIFIDDMIRSIESVPIQCSNERKASQVLGIKNLTPSAQSYPVTVQSSNETSDNQVLSIKNLTDSSEHENIRKHYTTPQCHPEFMTSFSTPISCQTTPVCLFSNENNHLPGFASSTPLPGQNMDNILFPQMDSLSQKSSVSSVSASVSGSVSTASKTVTDEEEVELMKEERNSLLPLLQKYDILLGAPHSLPQQHSRKKLKVEVYDTDESDEETNASEKINTSYTESISMVESLTSMSAYLQPTTTLSNMVQSDDSTMTSDPWFNMAIDELLSTHHPVDNQESGESCADKEQECHLVISNVCTLSELIPSHSISDTPVESASPPNPPIRSTDVLPETASLTLSLHTSSTSFAKESNSRSPNEWKMSTLSDMYLNSSGNTVPEVILPQESVEISQLFNSQKHDTDLPILSSTLVKIQADTSNVFQLETDEIHKHAGAQQLTSNVAHTDAPGGDTPLSHIVPELRHPLPHIQELIIKKEQVEISRKGEFVQDGLDVSCAESGRSEDENIFETRRTVSRMSDHHEKKTLSLSYMSIRFQPKLVLEDVMKRQKDVNNETEYINFEKSLTLKSAELCKTHEFESLPSISEEIGEVDNKGNHGEYIAKSVQMENDEKEEACHRFQSPKAIDHVRREEIGDSRSSQQQRTSSSQIHSLNCNTQKRKRYQVEGMPNEKKNLRKRRKKSKKDPFAEYDLHTTEMVTQREMTLAVQLAPIEADACALENIIDAREESLHSNTKVSTHGEPKDDEHFANINVVENKAKHDVIERNLNGQTGSEAVNDIGNNEVEDKGNKIKKHGYEIQSNSNRIDNLNAEAVKTYGYVIQETDLTLPPVKVFEMAPVSNKHIEIIDKSKNQHLAHSKNEIRRDEQCTQNERRRDRQREKRRRKRSQKHYVNVVKSGRQIDRTFSSRQKTEKYATRAKTYTRHGSHRKNENSLSQMHDLKATNRMLIYPDPSKCVGSNNYGGKHAQQSRPDLGLRCNMNSYSVQYDAYEGNRSKEYQAKCESMVAMFLSLCSKIATRDETSLNVLTVQEDIKKATCISKDIECAGAAETHMSDSYVDMIKFFDKDSLIPGISHHDIPDAVEDQNLRKETDMSNSYDDMNNFFDKDSLIPGISPVVTDEPKACDRTSLTHGICFNEKAPELSTISVPLGQSDVHQSSFPRVTGIVNKVVSADESMNMDSFDHFGRCRSDLDFATSGFQPCAMHATRQTDSTTSDCYEASIVQKSSIPASMPDPRQTYSSTIYSYDDSDRITYTPIYYSNISSEAWKIQGNPSSSRDPRMRQTSGVYASRHLGRRPSAPRDMKK